MHFGFVLQCTFQCSPSPTCNQLTQLRNCTATLPAAQLIVLLTHICVHLPVQSLQSSTVACSVAQFVLLTRPLVHFPVQLLALPTAVPRLLAGRTFGQVSTLAVTIVTHFHGWLVR